VQRFVVRFLMLPESSRLPRSAPIAALPELQNFLAPSR
jgi:hypothetical protein